MDDSIFAQETKVLAAAGRIEQEMHLPASQLLMRQERGDLRLVEVVSVGRQPGLYLLDPMRVASPAALLPCAVRGVEGGQILRMLAITRQMLGPRRNRR